MRRAITLMACTAAALALAAGPAAAGEWNRNGDRTGAYDQFYSFEHNMSACMFSGLDEDFVRNVEEDHPDPFLQTQNYGQLVKLSGPAGPDGFTPATSGCNPTRPGGEE